MEQGLPPGERERLGTRERLLLLRPTVMLQISHAWGCLRYVFSKHLRPTTRRLPAPVQLPTGDWAAASEEIGTQLLSCRFWHHSMRTWYFATAMAEMDSVPLDEELMFVVAALHDIGLFQPRQGRCFTAVGADLARSTAASAGVSADRAELAAEAISAHISPSRPRGVVGQYLQAGSMLDVIGYRMWRLDPMPLR